MRLWVEPDVLLPPDAEVLYLPTDKRGRALQIVAAPGGPPARLAKEIGAKEVEVGRWRATRRERTKGKS